MEEREESVEVEMQEGWCRTIKRRRGRKKEV